MKRKPVTVKAPGADYEIRVVGDRRRAAARLLSRAAAAALVGDDRARSAAAFLVANALFAVGLPGGRRRRARGAGVVPRRVLLQRADDGDDRLRRDVPGVDGGQRPGRRRVDRQPDADRAGDRAGVREVLALDGALRVLAPRGDLADERRADADVPARQRARQPDRRRADPAGAWCAPSAPARAGRSTGCSTSSRRASARCRCRARGTCCTRSTRRARSPARRRRRVVDEGGRAAGDGDRHSTTSRCRPCTPATATSPRTSSGARGSPTS